MKTSLRLFIVPALLCFASLGNASTYTGFWKNKTFGSTGDLTINLTITKAKVSGSFDLDGPVFGGLNPPAIPFNVPLKTDGSGSFNVKGTVLGDVKGSFKSNGDLSFTITHIPGGFLTEARFNGKFDLRIEKFSGTYEIDSSGGLYATGSTAAHVPQAPTLQVAKQVNVGGTSGQVKAKVLTNSKIKSFSATADGNAKTTVTGTNPYTISVKKMTLTTTRLTLLVKNIDGFQTSKVVKFVRTGNSSTLEAEFFHD